MRLRPLDTPVLVILVVLLLGVATGCRLLPTWSEPAASPPAPVAPQVTAPVVPPVRDTPEIKAARRSLSRLEKVLGPEDPVAVRTAIQLADLLAAEGRHAEAEPLLERTLERVETARGSEDSEVGSLMLALAEARLEAGRAEESRLLTKRAVAIAEASTSGSAYIELLRRAARLQVRFGRTSEAAELYARAFRAQLGGASPPESPPEPQIDGPVDELALQDRMFIDLQQQNPAASLLRLEAALAKMPDSAALHLLRGRVLMMYAGRGDAVLDEQAAQAELERSIELDPALESGYESLAALYDRLERVDEAIERYASLGAGGEDASAQIMLGELYAATGDFERAIYAYEAAASVEAAPLAAQSGLARLLALHADGDPARLQRAIELARAAHAAAPERASVLDTLGRAIVESGEGSEAIPLLQDAVAGYGALEPQRGAARYMLARAYEQTGDAERALEQLELALRGLPFPEQNRAAQLFAELQSRAASAVPREDVPSVELPSVDVPTEDVPTEDVQNEESLP